MDWFPAFQACTVIRCATQWYLTDHDVLQAVCRVISLGDLPPTRHRHILGSHLLPFHREPSLYNQERKWLIRCVGNRIEDDQKHCLEIAGPFAPHYIRNGNTVVS